MSLSFLTVYKNQQICLRCRGQIKSGSRVYEITSTTIEHFPEGYRDDVEPGQWATDLDLAETVGVFCKRCFKEVIHRL